MGERMNISAYFYFVTLLFVLSILLLENLRWNAIKNVVKFVALHHH